VALFVTAGIVADRYFSIPLLFSMLTTVGSLVVWLGLCRSTKSGLPLLYLWIAGAGLGAASHHAYREGFSADDIGRFATADPRPVRLRGAIVKEPNVLRQAHDDPLRSQVLNVAPEMIDQFDPTLAVLEATQLSQDEDWFPVSGRVRLIVTGLLPELHAGDEIEVVGRLTAPSGPANPGELDYASFLKDQRIRAVLAVRKTADGVIVLARKWPRSIGGWLGYVRSWAQHVLQDKLPKKTAAVATALLLGEGSTMTQADWEKYIRTAVIHVLAISGQHLVILAGFLWAALRLLRVRRRQGALGVALFLFAYCLLTGGRPPAIRAAVAVGAYCGGILLRRPAMTANSFALGWLVIAALNPTDLFSAGCQLSFLGVALLYWGTSRWFYSKDDPLDRLEEETWPAWYRILRGLVRSILKTYCMFLVVWLALAPLVASHTHLISPIGVLIGPPVILLGSVALLAGFCLLFAAAIHFWPLVWVCAFVSHWSLSGCEWIVHHADSWSLGHWYVSDIPAWWLWLFYVGLLGFLMLQTIRKRVRWVALAGLGWLSVGLISGWSRPASNELRCTFLAVGHGGCTVLETPDGRVLLYDAGALGGPDVTRKQIAPFLWSRNIRRIDEVFLSHADLDHFNGLPSLLDRFAVGQVSCTPTFADKTAPGVPVTLDAIRGRGIPMRILKAGDHLSAGSVALGVLHPPADGPPGKENLRSLVLVVHHGDHRLMLTGDLEGAGLERVLALGPLPVDILTSWPFLNAAAADTNGYLKYGLCGVYCRVGRNRFRPVAMNE
jgi:competence protein ComEC